MSTPVVEMVEMDAFVQSTQRQLLEFVGALLEGAPTPAHATMVIGAVLALGLDMRDEAYDVLSPDIEPETRERWRDTLRRAVGQLRQRPRTFTAPGGDS